MLVIYMYKRERIGGDTWTQIEIGKRHIQEKKMGIRGLIKEICQNLRNGRPAGGETQEQMMNGMPIQEGRNITTGWSKT